MKPLKKIRLYPNGFLFTSESTPLTLSDFRHVELSGGYHYYYERGREPEIYQDAENDAFLIMHGHYAFVDLQRPVNFQKMEWWGGYSKSTLKITARFSTRWIFWAGVTS